ncbi:MAG: transporter substrate-binding domain-containing protein [Sneathiella sp.]|nr:transporter substrate-binding domain-containing protein [Sneathiella sp.]
MIRQHYLLSYLLLMLLAFCSAAAAEEKAPVFQTIGQEPYSFQSSDGQYDGYHYQIANRILEEAGYTAKAQPVPLRRLIHDTKGGLSDCMLAGASPFAKANFALVETVGHDLIVGILPRAGLDLNSYDDLKNIRIGVPAGMSVGDPFDSDETLIKVPTPDYFQSSIMLNYDRIDAIMGAIESIRYSAHKALPGEKVVFGKPLITQRFPVALLCNKGKANTVLVKRLKEATVRLRESGEFAQIIGVFFAPML